MSEELKTELDLLKERATTLGITYSPNIGLETLKAKINDKLGTPEPEEEEVIEEIGETQVQRRMRLNDEARILHRVRVTCMNPNKKSMTGEIFTVSNRVVGTIRRFVPFDTEDGWHVEDMILKLLRSKKFQSFYWAKGMNGQKVRRGKLVPEFAIEVLPSLTKKELDDLAKRQAMTGSLKED